MRLLFVFILLISNVVVFACTTFFMNKNGQMVFGRNYDWVTGNGFVAINKSGLAKTSFKMSDGATISWTSKFGSITFNQYGKEFPTGGMNESGLVVELMWLDDTRYEAPDERPSLHVLQWIQYQLDNFSSVKEILHNLEKVRVSVSVPLHYLVADTGGHSATIEFLDGKPVIHTDKSLPNAVLANDTYRKSLAFLQKQSGENKDSSFQRNSLNRFATACEMVSSIQSREGNSDLKMEAFNILDKVSQESFTKWSIVYDLTNRKILFKTSDAPEIRELGFSSFAFTCSAPDLAFPLADAARGDIARHFKSFDSRFNEDHLKRSLTESREYVKISQSVVNQYVAYPGTIFCEKK